MLDAKAPLSSYVRPRIHRPGPHVSAHTVIYWSCPRWCLQLAWPDRIMDGVNSNNISHPSSLEPSSDIGNISHSFAYLGVGQLKQNGLPHPDKFALFFNMLDMWKWSQSGYRIGLSHVLCVLQVMIGYYWLSLISSFLFNSHDAWLNFINSMFLPSCIYIFQNSESISTIFCLI